MGLFDKLLGAAPSFGAATSIGAATQGVSLNTGEYIISASQADLAQQQRNALMNTIHTPSKPPFAFDPDNPAWSASISTIVDLWLAKFGDKWVEESELEGDIFFAIVATRLLQTKRLEKHNVPNKFQSVYRIVE
jgi:hypothetical protein